MKMHGAALPGAAEAALHSALPSYAASLAIAGAGVAVLALGALHVLSSEFNPSWRMVSEYARGQHAWLLGIMFIAIGVSHWALATSVWPIADDWTGRMGSILLVVAGIGAASAAVFDIDNKLHVLSFVLGVPTLPIAAILLTLSLRHSGVAAPWWAAHLTWITVVVLAVAMGLFVSALKKHGVELNPERPLTSIPEGVVAYVGWANRILILGTLLWIALVAKAVLSLPRDIVSS